MTSSQPQDEQWKAELEDRRAQRELDRYKIDQDIAQRQRDAVVSSGSRFRVSAAQATLAAAAFAAIGALASNWIQSSTSEKNSAINAQNALEIEAKKAEAAIALDRQKFETTLILKAVESPNEDDRIRNLQFFLSAGFISDPDNKIGNMDVAEYPSLPPPDINLISFDDAAFSSFPAPLITLLKTMDETGQPDMLRRAEQNVEKLVTISLTVNQKSALTSLVYNTGAARFSSSKLLDHINKKDFSNIDQDFMDFNSGKTFKALIIRRQMEAKLFMTPD